VSRVDTDLRKNRTCASVYKEELPKYDSVTYSILDVSCSEYITVYVSPTERITGKANEKRRTTCKLVRRQIFGALPL
jgi:hypothetical protein